MPPAEKLGNGESVSIYFAPGNSHEAFLDIRQTSAWYKIRKDPIFVVFTDEELTQNLVPLEQCLAIRDRPDQPLEETTADEGEDGDEDMHDASRSPGTLPWSSPDLPRRFGSVMDTLEQALSSDTEAIRSSLPKASGIPSRDQRQEEILAKLGVTGSARDQNQEDILAKLGVTGSPKPPSNEPVLVDFSPNDKLPASLPEKPPAPPPSRYASIELDQSPILTAAASPRALIIHHNEPTLMVGIAIPLTGLRLNAHTGLYHPLFIPNTHLPSGNSPNFRNTITLKVCLRVILLTDLRIAPPGSKAAVGPFPGQTLDQRNQQVTTKTRLMYHN